MTAEPARGTGDADAGPIPSAGGHIAPYLYPALTLLGLVVTWQAFTRLSGISRLLLPAPSDVARTLGASLPLLAHMSAITGAEFVLGFGLSVAVGIPLGALLVYVRPSSSRSIRCSSPPRPSPRRPSRPSSSSG